jgi:hypothetical protein
MRWLLPLLMLLLLALPCHAQQLNPGGGIIMEGGPAGIAVLEFNLSMSGPLGGLTSAVGGPRYQTCDVMQNGGHFSLLSVLTDLNGGTCTTPPQFNVRDATQGTSGSAVVAPTNDGILGSVVQTLSFAAGDTVCITRTVNGATCTAPWFFVTAHITEP